MSLWVSRSYALTFQQQGIQLDVKHQTASFMLYSVKLEALLNKPYSELAAFNLRKCVKKHVGIALEKTLLLLYTAKSSRGFVALFSAYNG